MGRGLKVQKREYQEVNIGLVGHRNRRDDGSNRMRKGKVPNRYNIVRGSHLMGKTGLQIDPTWTTDNVLEVATHFYLNPYINV